MEWMKPEDMKQIIEKRKNLSPESTSEYGSPHPVRFNPPKLYDNENNEMKRMCKCGKEASTFVVGSDSYLGLCTHCAYGV